MTNSRSAEFRLGFTDFWRFWRRGKPVYSAGYVCGLMVWLMTAFVWAEILKAVLL